MIAVVCVCGGFAQHGQPAPRSAPAPHAAAPQSRPQPAFRQPPQTQNRGQFRQPPETRGGTPQYRMPQQSQGRPLENSAPRPNNVPRVQPAFPSNGGQTGYPGSTTGRQEFTGTPQQGPGKNASAVPQGHLEDWLNQHRNVPMQDQEKMLRNDPSFKRLPQGDQQRLTQQLRRMDQMPERQRDRRLARNEMLERLSPNDRQSIARSGRQWSSLPPDRQATMRRAFNDLRGVPLDQRQTVLNSARYQGAFSPEERGILSDFLRVEPYEPAH